MNPREQFLHFIREREKARISKELLGKPPYSCDAVIAIYKFCNINREHDTVTKWIADNVRGTCYSPQELVINMLICRIFNEPKTLIHLLPYTNMKDLALAVFTHKKTGAKLFRGAYMMPSHSTQGGQVSAGAYYCRVVDDAAQIDFNDCIELRQVAEKLLTIRGLGEFLVNQVCTDLRYTTFFEHAKDWTEFVMCGPGTRRGINQYLGLDKDHHQPQKQFIKHLFNIYNLLVQDLDKGKIDRILLEYFLDPNNLANAFCEFDKYLRALNSLINNKRVTIRKYKNGNNS